MRKIFILLLVVFVFISCKSKPEIIEEPEIEIEPEPVIEILDPVFEVISIVILQADLVVTEFEAVLKVTNPNEFSVDLVSLTYELYGNGGLWARGNRSDILQINALSSSETKFRFSMNFIDMRRSLLDDVIAMRQVLYRFKGTALIQPDLLHTEPFYMNYDCTGMSEVVGSFGR